MTKKIAAQRNIGTKKHIGMKKKIGGRRKITMDNNFMKKYKTDMFVIGGILLFIIFLIIIIIYMNVSRRKQIESFNTYKLRTINNRISKYIAQFRKPKTPLNTGYTYDTDVIDNVYLIEQIRNNKMKMDDYTIKSNIGNIIFNTEGIWDLQQSKFQLVSTGGQGIAVEDSGASGYFFSIGNIKIQFHYKKVKIFGKIIIDDGDQQIIIYMKKNNKYINFYTEDNKRVAYSKLENITNEGENSVYTNKLIITKKYNHYYNIFIIVFIVYLQIFKDQNNTEFL